MERERKKYVYFFPDNVRFALKSSAPVIIFPRTLDDV